MLEDYCVDLYCGLGGWAEGFLAEGIKVIGFDIERHDYGTGGYPAQLVIQDVLTLHGSQFKRAAVIVASPPCTEPSYRAMPWKRAKALNAIGPPHKFIALFEACFRIQREASEAAGRHIPMIVENVRGAQPWVGRSAWNFGSYHLWGDIPALMPIPSKRMKFNPDGTGHPPGSWFAIADSKNRGARAGGPEHNPRDDEPIDREEYERWEKEQKQGCSCECWRCKSGGHCVRCNAQINTGTKLAGQDWSRFAKTGEVSPHWRMEGQKLSQHLNIRDSHSRTRHLTNPDEHRKIGGDWFSDPNSTCRRHGSKSKARKAASAQIAKIPFPLARHIAKCFKASF